MTAATAFFQETDFITAAYVVAFSMFITGLAKLTSPTTAVQGNKIAAVGMLIAVVATLLNPELDGADFLLIAIGLIIGTIVGIPSARNVKMTAMPQMVALFNGVGGGAVALIAWAEFRELGGDLSAELEVGIPLIFAAIIGSISFWGSNIAFAKLQGLISGSPVKIPGGLFVNIGLLLVAIGAAIAIRTQSPTCSYSSVATTAITMPTAATRLPRTAVRGPVSPAIPSTNRLNARMYSALMKSVSCRNDAITARRPPRRDRASCP